MQLGDLLKTHFKLDILSSSGLQKSSLVFDDEGAYLTGNEVINRWFRTDLQKRKIFVFGDDFSADNDLDYANGIWKRSELSQGT